MTVALALRCSAILCIFAPLSPAPLVFRFTTNSSKVDHMKRHRKKQSGGSSLVCPHEGCGQSFVFRVQLKRHLQTHTDVFPFTCPEPSCLKKFKDQQVFQVRAKPHDDCARRCFLLLGMPLGRLVDLYGCRRGCGLWAWELLLLRLHLSLRVWLLRKCGHGLVCSLLVYSHPCRCSESAVSATPTPYLSLDSSRQTRVSVHVTTATDARAGPHPAVRVPHPRVPAPLRLVRRHEAAHRKDPQPPLLRVPGLPERAATQ